MLKKIASLICLATVAAHAAEMDPLVIYSELTKGLDVNIYGGHCAARADVWAFEIEQLTKQKPSKALILYTNDFHPNNWTFHVAPTLQINGEWVVFEKANGIDRPLALLEWMNNINGGRKCKVHESVPPVFKDAFYSDLTDNWGRPIFRFDARKSSGECGLFITDREMLSPGDGFLDYMPPAGAHQPDPFGYARVSEMCKSLKPKKSKKATEEFCKQRLDRFF